MLLHEYGDAHGLKLILQRGNELFDPGRINIEQLRNRERSEGARLQLRYGLKNGPEERLLRIHSYFGIFDAN